MESQEQTHERRKIEDRPAIVSEGTEIGHWEIDTVVGQREGREAVAFTAVEKGNAQLHRYSHPGRTSAGVEDAMNKLRRTYTAKNVLVRYSRR